MFRDRRDVQAQEGWSGSEAVVSSAEDRLQGQHSFPGGRDCKGRGQILWCFVLSQSHGVGLYFREQWFLYRGVWAVPIGICGNLGLDMENFRLRQGDSSGIG